MNKITVITPTYNRAHTLPRAYESLKKQTFKDFCWVIMDDGSTDNTRELVEKFQQDESIVIDYHHNENSKKFYTVFQGIEKVKTDYFTILDSDDAYPENALQILADEAEKLDKTKFISVIGHSEDENGKVFGTLFPGDGFDGSVLEMRYKYKIRGDKNGIFITNPYHKYLKNFNYKIYKNKYAPQQIFFNIYDADGMKTRFINKVIRTYYYDENDANSMSKDRIKPSSFEGLRDAHLSFLNSYGNQLLSYPKSLFRNIIGFQEFSFLLGDPVIKIISSVKSPVIKSISWLLLPLSYIYAKVKS